MQCDTIHVPPRGVVEIILSLTPPPGCHWTEGASSAWQVIPGVWVWVCGCVGVGVWVWVYGCVGVGVGVGGWVHACTYASEEVWAHASACRSFTGILWATCSDMESLEMNLHVRVWRVWERAYVWGCGAYVLRVVIRANEMNISSAANSFV